MLRAERMSGRPLRRQIPANGTLFALEVAVQLARGGTVVIGIASAGAGDLRASTTDSTAQCPRELAREPSRIEQSRSELLGKYAREPDVDRGRQIGAIAARRGELTVADGNAHSLCRGRLEGQRQGQQLVCRHAQGPQIGGGAAAGALQELLGRQIGLLA